LTSLPISLSQLVYRPCTQLVSMQPSTICIKDSYKVEISGHGFGNLKSLSQVLCRFTFSDSRIVDKAPIGTNGNTISCPGPKLLHPGEKVSLGISLNNGLSFIGNKLILTGTSCENTGGEMHPSRDTARDWLKQSRSKDDIGILGQGVCKEQCAPVQEDAGKTQTNSFPFQEPEEKDLPPPSTSPPAPPAPPPPAPLSANPNLTPIVAGCDCGNRTVQNHWLQKLTWMSLDGGISTHTSIEYAPTLKMQGMRASKDLEWVLHHPVVQRQLELCSMDRQFSQ
ncbi:hypothetical protein STEG23_022280, partial [Scotinomys teguina]